MVGQEPMGAQKSAGSGIPADSARRRRPSRNQVSCREFATDIGADGYSAIVKGPLDLALNPIAA